MSTFSHLWWTEPSLELPVSSANPPAPAARIPCVGPSGRGEVSVVGWEHTQPQPWGLLSQEEFCPSFWPGTPRGWLKGPFCFSDSVSRVTPGQAPREALNKSRGSLPAAVTFSFRREIRGQSEPWQDPEHETWTRSRARNYCFCFWSIMLYAKRLKWSMLC